MRIWRRRRAVVCRAAVALMAGYLDGTLTGRDRARLDDHLAGCPHCTEHLSQLQRTIAALGRAGPEDLPDETLEELVGVYRRWMAD